MLNEQQKQLLETVQAQIAAGQHLALGDDGARQFEMLAAFLERNCLTTAGHNWLLRKSNAVSKVDFGFKTPEPAVAERIAALEQQLAQALARNAALEARVGVLEAALKPFAEAAEYDIDVRDADAESTLRFWNKSWNEDLPIEVGTRLNDEGCIETTCLEVQHLRNAAAALKGDSNA